MLAISAVNDSSGKATQHIGVFSDISERKFVEEQIRYLSSRHVLTGLPDRMLFKDRLESALFRRGNKEAIEL